MMHVPFDLASRRKYLEQEFPDAEYDRRLAAVRTGMAREGLDALVIHCGAASYATARWLTNYQAFNGTTFLVVVIAVSIVLGAVATPLLLPNAKGAVGWVLTFLLRLSLLPLIAAISYELQRLSARYCTVGPLRVLLWPGFLFQRITTREPSENQLEVAIAAMEMARVREEADKKPAQSDPDRVHVFQSFEGVRQAAMDGFAPSGLMAAAPAE